MDKGKSRPSWVFKVGAISLAFLVLGYQVALFVHRAAAERVVANRDHPDTVYVVDRKLAEEVLGGGGFPVGSGKDGQIKAGNDGPAGRDAGRCSSRQAGDSGTDALVIRKPSTRSPEAKAMAESYSPRRVENFRFDPNTVSVEDLMRLGFSEKQAQSIDNYREKGGRFRRKSDFAKSYVVADSVYKRLEAFIDIPKTDINKADSAAFDALPGIGGWTAAKMVEYRQRLHGYSRPEQLMEIYHFDRERYDGLKDLICCSPPKPYPFWSLPADSLRLHPHIRSWQTAKAIVFYRENNPRGAWTIDGLYKAGILNQAQAEKLRLCLLE